MFSAKLKYFNVFFLFKKNTCGHQCGKVNRIFFFFTQHWRFSSTCNPQFRQPILCQNYWLEKLKVILIGSSPSSNPGEAALFSCVSSTCMCSVWPKAAPAISSLPCPPPPPPSPVTDMELAVIWEFMPKLLLLDSAWMQIQEKALWAQCLLHCSHGILPKKPFEDTALQVGFLYKTQSFQK